MKRLDKVQFSAWVLLSVFIPMVLLSSLHVHPDLLQDGDVLCHECIEHVVHNGHFSVAKAVVDCPLCAFQNNVYQGEDATFLPIAKHTCTQVMDAPAPAAVIAFIPRRHGRSPPLSFCLS